jgi:uncharacterized protein (DUF433 family)
MGQMSSCQLLDRPLRQVIPHTLIAKCLTARGEDGTLEATDAHYPCGAVFEPERSMARVAVERTEHPHIVRDMDVAGGEPFIVGTKTSVRHVVLLYRAGQEPEEIARTYHVLLAEVYDAISYYYDHETEISRYIMYEDAPHA